MPYVLGNTCDECNMYNLASGWCQKHSLYRHSCGEDACNDFILADDLKELLDVEPSHMVASVLQYTFEGIK